MTATNSYATPPANGRPGPFAIPTDLLIGDGWRAAASGKRIDILDPSTEQVLTSVADASVGEGIAAVDAAAMAAAAWAATAPRKRAEILQACFHAMMAEQEWLAQLISLENGKAISDARGEVAYAAEFFRWYGEEAVRINGDLAI
jgi:succinate-semialdehyde dehydrogenase/glutarate-semialdehyde dehydrogenase